MKITKRQLRRIIKEAAFKSTLHRCMDGAMVDPSSERCLEDLKFRIEDAQWARDSHSCGTENRIYYNGLLKSLRQRRNRLAKILVIQLD